MIPKSECQRVRPESPRAALLDALSWLASKYADPKYGSTTEYPARQKKQITQKLRLIAPRRQNPEWTFTYAKNWDQLGKRAPDHLLSFFNDDKDLNVHLVSNINIVPPSGNAFLGFALKTPGEMTQQRSTQISEFVCQQVLDIRGCQFVHVQPRPLAEDLMDESKRSPQGTLYIPGDVKVGSIPFSGPRTLGHLTERVLTL
jgi:hypothetical protein